MNEQEMITRILAGDDRPFTQLIAPYERMIISRMLRMTGDIDDAKDLWQETLIRVWRHLPRFDSTRAKFSTWITRIAINLAINTLRNGRRRRIVADVDTLAESLTADPRLEPDHLTHDREIDQRLTSALAGLPARQREAFERREFRGESYEAIAVAMGISLGTVKSRLNRTRQRLAVQLQAVAA